MSKEAKILIAIAGVVVIGGVILAIFFNPQPKEPGQAIDSQSLVRDTSHMTGKKDAKVTFVEFGDFQCPACAAAAPNIEKLMDDYKGNDNVNFVFRNFPLDTIHPNAHIGSEAAEAAGEQGKFWEMYKVLYEKQTEWSVASSPIDYFVSYAQQLGLNVDQFRSSVTARKFSDIINTDYSDGEKAGVNSTPTIFINGEKTNGYQYDELKSKIEEKLK